jgi:hypothetical protein
MGGLTASKDTNDVPKPDLMRAGQMWSRCGSDLPDMGPTRRLYRARGRARTPSGVAPILVPWCCT